MRQPLPLQTRIAHTIRIVIDRDTGKPKGYGFCEFYDRATAESAFRNLQGADVGGRALRIDYAEGNLRGPGTVHRGCRGFLLLLYNYMYYG